MLVLFIRWIHQLRLMEKKSRLQNGSIVDRGEKRWEGYVMANGTSVLDHINFPYNAYDILISPVNIKDQTKSNPS